jgi:AraC family transcriptional regulator, regulatory protein of adaptative response / methylated-DNA-[protein]-cysteine methyltransferase
MAEQQQLIARLCEHITTAETTPTIQELAEMAGWSASHLQRVFKACTGVTPGNYIKSQRRRQMRNALHSTERISDAIYAAGYESSGRFYEDAPRHLGMTPSAYRKGGKDVQIQFAIAQCSLGAVLVAESPRGVCAILLGDEPEALLKELQDCFPAAELSGANPDFEQRIAEVIALVENPARPSALPLDIQGTAFQQRVWQALASIPAGETRSYTEVAEAIGAPNATRAVARACAANRLAVAVPCHRVVRQDGHPSGYRWGLKRKRTLLERERAAAEAALAAE